jgi:hypothetical protein
VESVELRVMGVQHSLDVGMAEIKGTLGLLVFRSEQTDKAIDALATRVKDELARRDAELLEAFRTRDKADEDRESRLRVVERRVYIAVGGALVLSSSAFLSYVVK